MVRYCNVVINNSKTMPHLSFFSVPKDEDSLLHVVDSINVQVEGDVAVYLRVSSDVPDEKWFRQGWGDKSSGEQTRDQLRFHMVRAQRSNNDTAAPAAGAAAADHVTAAPAVECVYQYPEKNQVDSMLSHMMNELTKVFVRANDFIVNPTAVRRRMKDHGEDHRGRLDQYSSSERRDDKRFHIVYDKNKQFFEKIYTNMTEEYNKFYNRTVERVDRTSARDPCDHQEEIKQIWHELLEHSLLTLKRATQSCVDSYLEDQNIDPHSAVGRRLRKFLKEELKKMKTNQLLMLCDVYQLCYNDLLK